MQKCTNNEITRTPFDVRRFVADNFFFLHSTCCFFFLIGDVIENFRLRIYFPLHLEFYYFDKLLRILDLVFIQLDSFTPFGRLFVFHFISYAVDILSATKRHTVAFKGYQGNEMSEVRGKSIYVMGEIFI